MAKRLAAVKKIQVSFQVRPKVWAAYTSIVRDANFTINAALERSLIDDINAGRIPGVEPIEMDAAGYKESGTTRALDDLLTSKPHSAGPGEIVGPQKQPRAGRAPSQRALQSK